jgi:hypothetical protein
MSADTPSSNQFTEAAVGLRVLAFIVSLAGICAASFLLWTTSSASDLAFVHSMQNIVRAGSTLCFSALALLIVLKAGDHPANVAMAAAIAVVFSVDTVSQVLFPYCSHSVSLLSALKLSLFILGAGFYLRASQMFPLPLDRFDVYGSPTVWGRTAFTRYPLALLLRSWITWVFVVSVTLLAFFAPFSGFFAAARIFLILVGIAYFHISFASGNPDVRRKVLWFLVGVLAVALLSVVDLGVKVTIGTSFSSEIREFVSLGLDVTSTLVILACLSTALFYAGAVSPTLVLRKTVVYGAIVTVFLFAFSVFQDLVIDSLVEGLGVSDRFMGAIMATLFGLAFYPVARRAEKLLRRKSD